MTDTPTRADLIERLRSVDVSWSEVGEWCAEAAAALTADAERIAALEGEVERLREALRRIDTGKYDGLEVHRVSVRQCHAIARAALKGTYHDPAQIKGQEA